MKAGYFGAYGSGDVVYHAARTNCYRMTLKFMFLVIVQIIGKIVLTTSLMSDIIYLTGIFTSAIYRVLNVKP